MYTALINDQDADGLMQLLTNIAVEDKVVERVRLKASTYGQDVPMDTTVPPTYKIAPSLLAELYRDIVMPLTKQVQVTYLLARLRYPVVAYLVGTRSYSAAQQVNGVKECIPVNTITAVVDAILSNEVALGILPYEHKETEDLLCHHPISIVSEISVLLDDYVLVSLKTNKDADTLQSVLLHYSVLVVPAEAYEKTKALLTSMGLVIEVCMTIFF